MNGGYIMIDCAGLDLTKGSTEQTITGLYNRVKNAMKTNKPIYCINAVFGNYGKSSPILCIVYELNTSTITLSASTFAIVVTENDVVTIQNFVS